MTLGIPRISLDRGFIGRGVRSIEFRDFYRSCRYTGFRGWLRKAGNEEVWRRAMEITNSLLRHARESEAVMADARTAEDWEEVNRNKEHEYGSKETFADPEHHSYPLTEGGKPSRERIIHAWDYINVRRNADKYSDHGAAVKRRIKAFASKHGIELHEGTKKGIGVDLPDGMRASREEKSEHAERGAFPGQQLEDVV